MLALTSNENDPSSKARYARFATCSLNVVFIIQALDLLLSIVTGDVYGKRSDWQVVGGLYPTILNQQNQEIEGIGSAGTDVGYAFERFVTGTFMWLCQQHHQLVKTCQRCIATFLNHLASGFLQHGSFLGRIRLVPDADRQDRSQHHCGGEFHVLLITPFGFACADAKVAKSRPQRLRWLCAEDCNQVSPRFRSV